MSSYHPGAAYPGARHPGAYHPPLGGQIGGGLPPMMHADLSQLERELHGAHQAASHAGAQLASAEDTADQALHQVHLAQLQQERDLEEKDGLHQSLHKKHVQLAESVNQTNLVRNELERTALESSNLSGQLHVCENVIDHERQERQMTAEELTAAVAGLSQKDYENRVLIGQLEGAENSAAGLANKLHKTGYVLEHERAAKGRLVHELRVSQANLQDRTLSNKLLSGELESATKTANSLSGALHQAENTVCHERAERTALENQLHDTKLGLAQQQVASIEMEKQLREAQLDAVAERAQWSAAQLELDGMKKGLAAQSEESIQLSRQLLNASSVVSSEVAAKSGLRLELEASQRRVAVLATQTEELRQQLLQEATCVAAEKAAKQAAALELELVKQGMDAMAVENERMRVRALEAESLATAEMAAKASALTELQNAKQEIANLGADNESLNKRLIEADAEVSRLNARNTVLEAELTTASNDLMVITKRMHEAELMIKSERNNKQMVQFELENAQSDMVALDNAKLAAEAELAAGRAHSEKLLEEMSKAQADLAIKQRGMHGQHLNMILWHQGQLSRRRTASSMREKHLFRGAFLALREGAEAADLDPNTTLKPKPRRAPSPVKQRAGYLPSYRY